MGSKIKSRKELEGKTFVNKYSEKFIVKEYIDNTNVVIEYEDGTRVSCPSENIRQGNTPNPMRVVVCGIGYHGIGNHRIAENGNKTIEYIKWHGMLYRVYQGNNSDCKSTACYNGVSVSDKWYNFQNFAEWFKENKALYSKDFNLCLDKDLFGYRSKMYSEDTCCLLPYELNIAIQIGENNVCLDKQRNTWITTISTNGRRPSRHLGRFKTREEALNNYFVAKNKDISDLAVSYKDFIPEVVFNALFNFNAKEIYEHKTNQIQHK